MVASLSNPFANASSQMSPWRPASAIICWCLALIAFGVWTNLDAAVNAQQPSRSPARLQAVDDPSPRQGPGAPLGQTSKPSPGADDWQSKVDPALLDAAWSQGPTEYLLIMEEQADLSAAAMLTGKDEKAAYVVKHLMETAHRTQGPALEALAKSGQPTRSLWIANMIWTRSEGLAIQRAVSLPGVARILANPRARLDEPDSAPEEATNRAQASKAQVSVEWNIAHIGAEQAWAAGFDGRGAVIAGQDTGYRWDHPALKNQYRGWNGTSALHDYNWRDAIHQSTGICGANAKAPCDDNGHGTHTMGTMVGDSNGGAAIGVAPGARWIGCRNMDAGDGTPLTYSECFQWFIAPTRLDGSHPDPARAPHVVNNSWSCPPQEGCTEPDILRTVVENVRAAGILVVQSAGNAGRSGCASVSTPAAIYEAAFSVGATDSLDKIADFSSRGPVTIDGSGRMKPDISAPGVSILSSTRLGGYGRLSGTSMAGPHVAGVAALILSANPALAGQVSAIERIIEQSARPLSSSQGCGGDTETSIPNNVYGHGRLDALAAVEMARKGSVSVNVRPPSAARDATRWRLNGGIWHDPGDFAVGLSPGDHLLSVVTGPAWLAPENRMLQVADQPGILVKETVTLEPSHPGDVNGDGRVDILDTLAVINVLLDAPANPTPIDADINRDDQVDARDVGSALDRFLIR